MHVLWSPARLIPNQPYDKVIDFERAELLEMGIISSRQRLPTPRFFSFSLPGAGKGEGGIQTTN